MVNIDDEAPLVLDLGTGLRAYGSSLPADGTFAGTALVTHLHWDHVQGLPFFTPLDRPGAVLDFYGPAPQDLPLDGAVDGIVRPPYFPVRLGELGGEVRFHEVLEDDFSVGPAKVRVRPVPHLGTTVGYRVELGGASIAYVSDHQAPPSLDQVSEQVLELCDGVDLLIHDAQFTREEFAEKPHWGHCTSDYAVLVAERAGARRLALFHHDPAHGDEEVDDILLRARELASSCGVDEVIAAAEGSVLRLGTP